MSNISDFVGGKDFISEVFISNLTTSDVSDSYSVPSGATTLVVMGCGGGGGGGGAIYHDTNDYASGGGGGGGFAPFVPFILRVVGGQVITYTLGARGNRGYGNNNAPSQVGWQYGGHGEDGGDTLISDYITFYGGKGGKGGQVYTDTSAPEGGDGGDGGSFFIPTNTTTPERVIISSDYFGKGDLTMGSGGKGLSDVVTDFITAENGGKSTGIMRGGWPSWNKPYGGDSYCAGGGGGANTLAAGRPGSGRTASDGYVIARDYEDNSGFGAGGGGGSPAIKNGSLNNAEDGGRGGGSFLHIRAYR